MNEYSKHEIEKFYSKFVNCTFEQADVANFFVMARDYSKKGSIIREVGDFLAHPNVKDRGIVLNSINGIMPSFDEMLVKKYKEKEDFPDIPVFKGLGSKDELIKDLVHIFGLAGLEPSEFEKESNSFRDFLFCTIFLLSTFKIKYKGRVLDMKVNYSYKLSLVVKCESSVYWQHYASLPVLTLYNNWIESNLAIPQVLEKFIARRFSEGYLAAISFEKDKEHEVCCAEKFNRGEVWPCFRR